MSSLDDASPMGLFGGSFDPVHYGHLRTAYELMEAVNLAEVRFLPAGTPPHREPPCADGRTRLALVRAAIAGQAGFIVDDRELRRQGPSYSVDTLLDLRAEHAHRSLCLLIGMDAFLGFPQWHKWREILQLAHLVVAHRPGWQAPATGTLGDLLRDRGTTRPSDLHEARAGRIFIHAVTQLEISSSAIRDLVRAGQEPMYLMPDPVRRLLAESGCYSAAAERD